MPSSVLSLNLCAMQKDVARLGPPFAPTEAPPYTNKIGPNKPKSFTKSPNLQKTPINPPPLQKCFPTLGALGHLVLHLATAGLYHHHQTPKHTTETN